MEASASRSSVDTLGARPERASRARLRRRSHPGVSGRAVWSLRHSAIGPSRRPPSARCRGALGGWRSEAPQTAGYEAVVTGLAGVWSWLSQSVTVGGGRLRIPARSRRRRSARARGWRRSRRALRPPRAGLHLRQQRRARPRNRALRPCPAGRRTCRLGRKRAVRPALRAAAGAAPRSIRRSRLRRAAALAAVREHGSAARFSRLYRRAAFGGLRLVDAGGEQAEIVGQGAVGELGDACAQDRDRVGR